MHKVAIEDGLKDKDEEMNITYDDLQKLLKEFRQQIEVLKEKLKEEDKAPKPATGDDEEDDAPKEEEGGNDEEENLLNELHELREFVNNNKECIEEFFNIKRGGEKADDDEHSEGHSDDDEEPGGQKETAHQQEVRAMLNSQAQGEKAVEDKIKDQLTRQEEDLLNQIAEQNEDQKGKLLEEFRNRIGGDSALSDGEKQALMEEMS